MMEDAYMDQPIGERWCILRTGGARTLTLCRSLKEAGIEAWSPVQAIVRRQPRAKTKEYVEAAFTPTYVFVREAYLPLVRRMEGRRGTGHPAFSIFRYYGATVFIAEASIAGLRAAEADSQRRTNQAIASRAGGTKRKRQGEPYKIGAEIVPTEGPFAGLSGVVRQSDGRHTMVVFGTVLNVTIETSILRRDDVARSASAA